MRRTWKRKRHASAVQGRFGDLGGRNVRERTELFGIEQFSDTAGRFGKRPGRNLQKMIESLLVAALPADTTHSMAKSTPTYSAKDRIEHSIYGTGTIVECTKHYTTISFDTAGTRKFLTPIVKLASSDTEAPARGGRKKKATTKKKATKKKATKKKAATTKEATKKTATKKAATKKTATKKAATKKTATKKAATKKAAKKKKAAK